MVLIKYNTIYLHSHSCDSLCPFMMGYGLYNNNFLISLSVKDRDIFLCLLVFFHRTSIPYLRSMEAFSISLPKSWEELTDEQLLFFFRQVARDLPMNEVLALCVCKWAELVVLCHTDKHAYLIKDKKSKRQVVLADWQVTFAARQLAFLESFAPMPVRIAVIGGASAVAADLQAVPFEDYLACENYYQGFLHTQSMECLAEMAHLLYPKLSDKACLEKAELLSVFYWFASVKANFTRMFPHFFTNIPQEKSNLLGSADLGVGEELRQAMNAQIRALTGGDITKEAAILQMDCWRALTELDAKAQEAQELRNQLK